MGSMEIGFCLLFPELLVFDKYDLIMNSYVQGEDIHGITGLVNLFGIESPGLTSSMGVAEHIATRFFRC